jgi:hypothetical protein
MTEDPSRIGLQPALTTSTGRSWLIVGGLFTVIALAVLLPMTWMPPAGVGLGASITVAVLYLAMVVVRLIVGPGPQRLRLLAGGLIAIALVSLVSSGIIAYFALATA